MNFLAALVSLAVVGVLLWRWLAPGMRGLPPGESVREGVIYALVGVLGTNLLSSLLVTWRDLPDPPPLERLIPLRAVACLLMVAVTLALASQRGGVRTVGLRRSGGTSSPLLIGLAAWLAFLPVLGLVSWLNVELLSALGAKQAPQHWIEAFLSSPTAQGSAATWLSMVLVLPFGEELWFRGGLYGSLRRVLSVPLAIAVSAAAFGSFHDAAYMLPTAALGAALCVVYERSGSLAAPLAFHALHNGLTLAIVSARLDWNWKL